MGVTCEDLEQQTFADEAFDLIVTQDVLEHEFPPDLVHQQIGRTLRSGGPHVHTMTGFDRRPGMIEWCQREISTRDGRFAFQHFDLRSVYVEHDQIAGSLSAAEIPVSVRYRFLRLGPDCIGFTHMPLDEIGHYLRELRRLVRPGGKILASVFFSESMSYVETINFFFRPVAFS
ncbi:MAG: class I SAM-dependent methyltransferase [Gammaproteobacteria bacterium]|nr:class I SAM-dependent methyltransferase [Gammaproteobacteria bacterium]